MDTNYDLTFKAKLRRSLMNFRVTIFNNQKTG
jgi:hypothetical protein